MSVFRLGPIGALREVPPIVQRGASVASERSGSTFTTLGGRRVVQRAPRGARTWSLDLGQWRDPSDLAYLSALATGAIPGPHYLYTDVAAQTNLLPADVAAPGAMGVSGLPLPPGFNPASAWISVPVGGGLSPMRAPTVGGALGQFGEWSRVVPLPPGDYMLSGRTPGSAGLDIIEWQVVAGADSVVSSGGMGATLTSVDDGSWFMSSQIEVPADVPGVSGVRLRTIGRTPETRASFGALRLTAGTVQDVGWLPGQGVPQVVVDDPSETLQLVTADRIAADYSITLREVG